MFFVLCGLVVEENEGWPSQTCELFCTFTCFDLGLDMENNILYYIYILYILLCHSYRVQKDLINPWHTSLICWSGIGYKQRDLSQPTYNTLVCSLLHSPSVRTLATLTAGPWGCKGGSLVWDRKNFDIPVEHPTYIINYWSRIAYIKGFDIPTVHLCYINYCSAIGYKRFR